MKTLVVYYSRKGSNEFLARQISSRLSCDMEALRPRINSFGLILFNLNTGLRRMKHELRDYDRVLLVGPIFMGRLIPPLRSFLRRHSAKIKELVFVTCCGSMDKARDDKFGHGLVFKKVEELLDGKLKDTQAFPVGLVLPEEQRDDQDAFMKARLDESTFRGEVKERFEHFMERIT
jgi:flavodoxin